MDLLPRIHKIEMEQSELLNRKSLTLDILLDGEPAAMADAFVLEGEKLLLHSMLSNLIKNAVEASPEGGAVTISLNRIGSTSVAIHNRGAVPPGIRKTFFEKYATSGKSGGSGLGTYSARLMAEVHGGRISMETSEERGTTVRVAFPPGIE